MRLISATLRHAVRLLAYGTVGVLLTVTVVFVQYLNGRPDLEVWHTAELDQEFTRHTGLASFEEYLALEERLFAQLDERVYAQTGTADGNRINRYQRGGLADPGRWSPDWNRSFVMQREQPRGAVLLLHGLSDAPYSLRQMAQELHARGATVVGLRIPGHGTAPSGLVTVRWQDMAAAVELAVRHLVRIAPGQPIHIVGYSNGAALAVHYALSALSDPDLPRIGRLVLISPEIGVTPVAALAVWQARLGHLLGLEKLAWNEIVAEYEPFKYGSFAVNAGDLSHRITSEIQRLLGQAEQGGRLGELPPILAFSSVVDATVQAPALVSNLLNRLPAGGGHELVLFDVNRRAVIDELLRWDPDAMIRALREAPRERYALTLITNADTHTAGVVERHWDAGSTQPVEHPLGLRWPDDVYSLSHVALPFPPDDPLYGGQDALPSPGIRLGGLALRGERGVLAVSDSAQLRQRWNPFYAYLEERAVRFMDLDGAARPGG